MDILVRVYIITLGEDKVWKERPLQRVRPSWSLFFWNSMCLYWCNFIFRLKTSGACTIICTRWMRSSQTQTTWCLERVWDLNGKTLAIRREASGSSHCPLKKTWKRSANKHGCISFYAWLEVFSQRTVSNLSMALYSQFVISTTVFHSGAMTITTSLAWRESEPNSRSYANSRPSSNSAISSMRKHSFTSWIMRPF